MTNFADIKDPLEWYYGSGYKLINPACRILTQNVAYRSTLEVGKADDYLFQYTVAKLTNDLYGQVTRNGKESKTWDWMEIDDSSRTVLLTKSASEVVQTYRDAGVEIADKDMSSTERKFRKSTHDYCFDRLKDLWSICKRVNAALVAASGRPGCRWVIRGEGTNSVGRMKGSGAAFSKGTVAKCTRHWTAPQFLSTTDGEELASVAQRGLIWLIRVKAADSAGRTGGAYQSEGEVLFPFGTGFRLDGGIEIDGTTDFGAVNVTALPAEYREEARGLLQRVYGKNIREGKLTHFLFATEVSGTAFT